MSDSESDHIFAGIAIFPAGVERYDLSISLVSSTGSFIDNISFSSPAERTALEKAVRSMITSTILNTRKIKPYFSSVPPAFPPDKHYDVFRAFRWAEVIQRGTSYPLVPLNHAEAFAALLPKGKTISLLALDFYSPRHLYVASLLSSTEEDGKRVNTVTQELSVSLAHVDSFHDVLEKIKSSLDPSGTNEIKTPEQIMLIKPLITPNGPEGVDIDAVVAELYPNTPVSTVTSKDIALAAASFAYANSILPSPRIYQLRRKFMKLPLSVATTSGAAVCTTRVTYIPMTYYIILTNSVDNQKSASVRLMLGNHEQTKNNIQRAVVVLDGLTPLPTGDSRIKVSIKMLAWGGWQNAIRVAIEQKDGPKKMFLFPCFFVNLPEDYREKYEISVKEEDEEMVLSRSDSVVGKLPE